MIPGIRQAVRLAGAALVLLVGPGADPNGAAPRFTGKAVPDPPGQRESWTPPDTKLPRFVVNATAALFEAGMADPRGCVYREVELREGGIVKTRAFVLPETPGAADRFAVGWDGVVYPVFAVGPPADLEADVRALIGAVKKAKSEVEAPGARPSRSTDGFDVWAPSPFPVFITGGPAVVESRSPLKLCMLLRLGRVDLAEPLFAAGTRWTPDVPRHDLTDYHMTFVSLANEWADIVFDRLIAAHQRGDDVVALDAARRATAFQKAVDVRAEAMGFERSKQPARARGPDSCIASLDIGDDYLARTTPEGRKKLAAAMRVFWEKNRAIPLVERWSRALRDDSAGADRWIEAAAGLARPLNTSGPPFARRVYAPRPKKPGEVLVTNGESLRSRRDPSVSDLMARRVMDILRSGDPLTVPDRGLLRACDLAVTFARWDEPAALPTLRLLTERCRERLRGDQESRRSDQGYGRQIAEFTLIRVRAGDRAALDEYGAWVRTMRPEPTARALSALEHPATADDVREGREIFSLVGNGEVRIAPMPASFPIPARWLESLPTDRPYGDGTTRRESLQDGWVWQAEEVRRGDHWERSYGFVGHATIARASASEIEFPPDRYRRPSLPDGLHARLELAQPVEGGLQPGRPVVVTLKIRNCRGAERPVPTEFLRPSATDGKPALRRGLTLALFDVAKDTDVVGASAPPLKGEHQPTRTARFDPGDASRILAPTESITVMAATVNDWFGPLGPGAYRVHVSFAKSSGLGAGTTNDVHFAIGDEGERSH